jgi:hypothetical protein
MRKLDRLIESRIKNDRFFRFSNPEYVKSSLKPCINCATMLTEITGHINLSLLQSSDFFNLAWDFLISKTNTSAAETTKIRPAVCNIWSLNSIRIAVSLWQYLPNNTLLFVVVMIIDIRCSLFWSSIFPCSECHAASF